MGAIGAASFGNIICHTYPESPVQTRIGSQEKGLWNMECSLVHVEFNSFPDFLVKMLLRNLITKEILNLFCGEQN